MMSYTCDTIWPMRIDLSSLECRQILREKELLCYSDVVSVLRAQGPLSEEKKNVLTNLQKILSISDERNKAELRRAANNEKLATIAENVSGFDAYTEWATLGALKFPPTQRPTPRTIYCDQASQTSITMTIKEKDFPSPIDTNDADLTEKHESAILTNRIINKDRRPVKTEATTKSHCSTFTMTDINKTPSQELFKGNASKEPSTSHDYNLHLLSEIATGGESSQSELLTDSIIDANNIKADSFSIHNQINDIESCQTSTAESSSATLVHCRQTLPSSMLLPASTNVVLSSSIKSLNPSIQDLTGVNLSANNVPVVLSNSAGQRYVLPRNTITQGINLISTNPQKNQVTSFMSQQGGTQTGYLTLSNNQLRSPPAHPLGASWNTGGQGTQLPQQVYIQNVSSHHGLNLQQNVVQHQSSDYANSLGYALKQRAITIAEQHKSHQVKNNLVVRNLGSQGASDSDRNKRFMVVKGNSNTGSMGPTTKKPKISNPSNRQPGRPPLMPAPSSAYTSRPYVANEIFHSNRVTSATGSMSADPCSGPLATDSNGLKISSISGGGAATRPGGGLQGTPSCPPSVSSISSASHGRVTGGSGTGTGGGGGGGGGTCQYFSGSGSASAGSLLASNRTGNGIQRQCPGTGGGSGTLVQLAGPAAAHHQGMVSMDTPGGVCSTSLRPKNIQPVISVVPLSPRGLSVVDSALSISSRDDDNGGGGGDQHGLLDKDSSTSYKIITKDEVYANLMERINPPSSMVSLNQSDNKIQ